MNALSDWMVKDARRSDREWERWDGTPADAERINDGQCARIATARATLPGSVIYRCGDAGPFVCLGKQVS